MESSRSVAEVKHRVPAGTRRHGGLRSPQSADLIRGAAKVALSATTRDVALDCQR